MVSNFYAEHKHELKTERGWNLAKRKVKEGAKRHRLWQGFCEYDYIFEADTEPMTDEEFKEYKHQEYLAKKEREEARRDKKEQDLINYYITDTEQWIFKWRTAYQWISEMKRKPRDDAEFEIIEKEHEDGVSRYYYCEIGETKPISDEEQKQLLATAPQLEDCYTNGGTYDGRPWWWTSKE